MKNLTTRYSTSIFIKVVLSLQKIRDHRIEAMKQERLSALTTTLLKLINTIEVGIKMSTSVVTTSLVSLLFISMIPTLI